MRQHREQLASTLVEEFSRSRAPRPCGRQQVITGPVPAPPRSRWHSSSSEAPETG